MKEKGQDVILPPNPAPYVTDWLFDIGPSVIGDAGEAPLGWQDMAAWERFTGIELDVWEARTIRSLSGEYLGQKHRSRKPDCPPPYSLEDAETVQDRVTGQFKAMLRALKPAQPARK